MITAFLMHLISAVLTLAAGAAFASGGKAAAFQCLFWGMFLFAIGNGIAEAVVNPLVATLFPKEKTHYLNILHAGWPGGLILGGLASYFMNPENAKAVGWQIQISLFLIPVVVYGIMLLGQRFPRSEASQHGVAYVDMLKEVGILGAAVICVLLGLFLKSDFGWSSTLAIVGAGALWLGFSAVVGFSAGPWLLAVLLFVHAMVGYVELGTDSWIGKITGAIMNSKQNGLLLFVYTSGLMFALRFFAGPIVHRLSPLGLLFVSGVLGFTGLQLLGAATSVALCIIAATIYALGKTFLWPTMLAVVSEQFPKGGAITIGCIGGVGMLSAGLLGGPGIGFKQDFHASQQLQTVDVAVYERFKAPNENLFLGFRTVGLDGAKVGILDDGGKEVVRALEIMRSDKSAKPEGVAAQEKLVAWWQVAKTTADSDKKLVSAAGLHGGRMALKLTSFVPLAMAGVYLLLILYFRARGGYKQVHIEGMGHQAKEVA
jgi:MFS family permease